MLSVDRFAILEIWSRSGAEVGAGNTGNTLGRWLREPAFRAAYRDARRRVVESAIARIQNATGEAVDALRRNLTCGRPGDEIRSAVAILDHAARGVELFDLAEWVDAIESRVAAAAGEA